MEISHLNSYIFNVIYIISIGCTNSYKFLLYPNNIESHILVFSKFGSALTENGHRVDLLIASNAHLNFRVDRSINIIRYPVRFEKPLFDTDTHVGIDETLDSLKAGYLNLFAT